MLAEVNDDGVLRYSGAVITGPRQSAKTTLFGAAAEHRLMTQRGARCWYTEKTKEDAVEWLRERHAPLLLDNPQLAKRVRVRIGNSAPGLRWPAMGSTLGLFSPAKGTTGKQSDLTCIDEAQAIHDVDRGVALENASIPTQGTRDGSQFWLLGTAGTQLSAWWLKWVLRGRASVDAGLRTGVAYVEYGCPADVDPLDPGRWHEWHPAYGYTITRDGMQRMLDLLGPDDFARQVGNQWPAGAVSSMDVVPAGAWRRAVERADMPDTGVVFAVAPAAGRENASVVAAWRDEDGMIRADLVHYDDGLSWVTTGVRSVPALLVGWPGSPVGAANEAPDLVVTDPLVRGGVDVTAMRSVREFAAATGYLIGLVETGHIKVCPSPRMDRAVELARLRSVGQGSAWLRRGCPEASPLVALTVAVWTLEHVEPEADVIPFRIG